MFCSAMEDQLDGSTGSLIVHCNLANIRLHFCEVFFREPLNGGNTNGVSRHDPIFTKNEKNTPVEKK